MKRGVLVGCDETLEWLLPWWWERYIAHNTLNVTFVDFGMSKTSLEWCKSKGEVVSLDTSSNFAHKDSLSVEQISLWEKQYGKDVWKARDSWFKKPEALLLTLYENTLWLDVDCEVMGSLDHMFSYLDLDSSDPLSSNKNPDFAIAREPYNCFLPEKYPTHNSGVILYKKSSPILKSWAEKSHLCSDKYLGDQDLLSSIISKHNFPISELPPEYNWRMSQGLNLNALIIHWAGTWGKTYIKTHGGLTPLLKHHLST